MNTFMNYGETHIFTLQIKETFKRAGGPSGLVLTRRRRLVGNKSRHLVVRSITQFHPTNV